MKSILLYDLYFINGSIVAILFFVHRLSSYLKTNAMSESRRKFHSALIRSLLAQVRGLCPHKGNQISVVCSLFFDVITVCYCGVWVLLQIAITRSARRMRTKPIVTPNKTRGSFGQKNEKPPTMEQLCWQLQTIPGCLISNKTIIMRGNQAHGRMRKSQN